MQGSGRVADLPGPAGAGAGVAVLSDADGSRQAAGAPSRGEIEACAREPIHAPGAIQPHGRLLLLGAGGAVLGGSAGPGAGAAPPGGLEDALDPESAGRVREALAACRGDGAGSVLLEALAAPDGARLSGVLHPAVRGGPALLELEPELEPVRRAAVARRVLGTLNDAISRLRGAADDAAAGAIAAGAIRRMTGFDRVMVYRFLPDWTGEVIAEDLSGASIDSFRGLRFPASDIPEQARALYLRAGLRLIPDARAAALDLAVAPGAVAGPVAGEGGLDLARCHLRAVSPVHLRYLANMDVRASMSVAITGRDGALWGLVACHHQAGVLHVAYETRQAAETLGRALGWRLGELAERRMVAAREAVAPLCARLAARLALPEETIEASLDAEADALARAAGSPVFALAGLSDRARRAGPDGSPAPGSDADALDAPGLDADTLDGLAEALDRQETAMLVTDRLDPARLGPCGARLARGGVCGLLAIRLIERQRGGPGTWAVWLRGEVVREVVWAGDPDKPTAGAQGEPASLSPRHSFAAWREQARGGSAPFAPPELGCAAAVADALGQGLLRRAGAVERANQELARRNDDIRFFSDAAVHDLREPLWQVQVFAGMLHEEISASPLAAENDDLPRMAGVIEDSARRMRLLLDDLAAFAGAGRVEALQPIRLDTIVSGVLADLEERIRHAGARIEIAIDPVPTVLCEALQMQRVFQNLIANALKYRAPGRDCAMRITAARESAMVRIGVEDNGLGFDAGEAAVIFEPFRRLGRHSATVSDGLGLGLAICRRIIESLGGTIEARGEVDRGARFDIVLPAGPRDGGQG